MYEPKRVPNITRKTAPFPELRYGIIKRDGFRDPKDPTNDSLHIHRYLEIFFSIDAEVTFLVNDTMYPVRAGDLIVSRPGDVHVCVFPKSAAYHYVCLWIDADFSLPFFSFLREKDFSPILSLDRERSAAIGTTFDGLCALTEKEKNSAKEMSYLFSVLSMLSEAHSVVERKSVVPSVLSEIIRFVKQNFAEIRTVADITEKFFISPSTLNRYFRTYLRTTPREYVETQKLAYAMELLKSGAGVTEACTAAGFADCSHFIVLFKKKFGETPLKYKKQMQENKANL